jgi:LPPG:FO 2-phospho-L-lactate transferase
LFDGYKNNMKVAALAGGVGGAKLADGLALALPPTDFTTIVNTGDDFEHLGLKICPDLDTVCYTLAGLANPETGWGLRGETWHALESLEAVGGPTWFRLGDHDLGTHLERTRRLREGQTLSQVTAAFCAAWGVASRVIPMSDEPVPTVVYTDEGPLPFQEYFVHRQCQPEVTGFHFEGVEKSRPAPGVLQVLNAADLVVICPSNPWVSIAPILAIPGVRDAVQGKQVVAVSPIIGGRAMKGPAAKMFQELGLSPSAAAVAKHYGAKRGNGILTGFVLDNLDADQSVETETSGVHTLTTNTMMNTSTDRLRLANELIIWFDRIRNLTLS